MKTRFASSIRLPLMAGALALFVTGCSSMNDSMHRSDRTVEPAGYVGQSGTPGIPSQIDPFSTSYRPFPASTNETGGVIGHSLYCVQHYNQPGCQTPDSVRNPKGMPDSARY